MATSTQSIGSQAKSLAAIAKAFPMNSAIAKASQAVNLAAQRSSSLSSGGGSGGSSGSMRSTASSAPVSAPVPIVSSSAGSMRPSAMITQNTAGMRAVPGGIASVYPSGWSNVWGTLTGAIGSGGVRSNTGIGLIDAPLGFVASHPFATAGVAAAGATMLGYGATAGTVAGTTGAASTVAAGSLRGYALAAGAGAVGGMILSGAGGPQNITIPQTQTLQPTITPQQGSTLYDNSLRQQWNTQNTINTITDSPYAQIGGSPSLTGGAQPSSFAPYQGTPVDLTAGQSANASQSSGSLLIPALIIGAAMLFSSRR